MPDALQLIESCLLSGNVAESVQHRADIAVGINLQAVLPRGVINRADGIEIRGGAEHVRLPMALQECFRFFLQFPFVQQPLRFHGSRHHGAFAKQHVHRLM